MAMPDIHQGYGFPIGGVVATRLPNGAISPGGVGYDINCGVRVMARSWTCRTSCRTWTGSRTRSTNFSPAVSASRAICTSTRQSSTGSLHDGSRWALREGFARPEDVAHTEEGGCMAGADPDKVSRNAKERGATQVGTLGSATISPKIDVITKVFDAKAADALGLRVNQAVVQVHCGSRGLGHQVATDYIELFQRASNRYGYQLPDRQLVCAPLDSPEGQSYLAAMNCAANYAWANRQVLTHHIREAFETGLGRQGAQPGSFPDLRCSAQHGEGRDAYRRRQEIRVCVHRKGATRAFGPGHPDVPADYREIGQPVLVPGSMGTASYILVGTVASMTQTFGSCCHGAGRVLSRAEAKRQVRGETLRGELNQSGIVIRAGSMAGLAEEAPKHTKMLIAWWPWSRRRA